MLTAFCAALMLFLLANREGEDAIFSNRGSIFIFSLVSVFKISEDELETLSVGDDSISGILLKKGRFGEQPVPPIMAIRKNARISKFNPPGG